MCVVEAIIQASSAHNIDMHYASLRDICPFAAIKVFFINDKGFISVESWLKSSNYFVEVEHNRSFVTVNYFRCYMCIHEGIWIYCYGGSCLSLWRTWDSDVDIWRLIYISVRCDMDDDSSWDLNVLQVLYEKNIIIHLVWIWGVWIGLTSNM